MFLTPSIQQPCFRRTKDGRNLVWLIFVDGEHCMV